MAHELMPYNVSSVSLYPGQVRTQGVMRYSEAFDMSHPNLQQQVLKLIEGDPAVVAGLMTTEFYPMVAVLPK